MICGACGSIENGMRACSKHNGYVCPTCCAECESHRSYSGLVVCMNKTELSPEEVIIKRVACRMQKARILENMARRKGDYIKADILKRRQERLAAEKQRLEEEYGIAN